MKNFADVHIHLSDFDFGKTYETLETVRAQGVTDVALQALGYRSVAYNLAMLYWKIRYTKMRVKVFGAMHLCDRYANVPFEEQAEKLIGLGVDGIKLIDMCPDIRQVTGKGVNDVKYDKMLSLLEKKGIPVLLHSADPETFWDKPDGAYCDGTFLSKQELYDETFEMLEKHPDLKIVLAHFFFLSDFPEEAAKVLDKYSNVCFDLTPGCEMYPNFSKRRDVWREFFIKYSDRILFGTDTNSNAGISPFLYHTLLDWHNPDYKNNFPEYLKYLRESVKILCTQYGKIGGLWFDGLWDKDDDWQIDLLYAMIRSFQPEAIIVNNQGISKSSRAAHKEVDVTTFERSNCEKLCDSSRPVVGEMCQVFGDHWGYAANDVNYKPFSTILNNFIDCRNNRCNFLLNTGLLPDGKVPLTDRAYFNAMGKWIKTNKNFVYNLKKTDITAEGAYIFFDGAHYYAVIKNVPMVANPNVQLKPEDIKKVKVSRPIKNAVWLDDGSPIDSTDGEFEVKTFKYGVSLCARVARFDI